MGCGIGYGYLHRIPAEIVEQKQKARGTAPPAVPASTFQPPAAVGPGSPDGFSDVCILYYHR